MMMKSPATNLKSLTKDKLVWTQTISITYLVLMWSMPLVVMGQGGVIFGDETSQARIPSSSGVDDSKRTGSLQTRANGLLASLLNQSPTGDNPSRHKAERFQEGRNHNNWNPIQYCCCVSTGRKCPFPYIGGSHSNYPTSLVDSGVITPRVKPGQNQNRTEIKSSFPRLSDSDISTRIVNRPPSGPGRPGSGDSCYPRHKCCYSTRQALSSVSSTCQPLRNTGSGSSGYRREEWVSGCRENIGRVSGKTCGARRVRKIFGVEQGEAFPNEFPWACIILKENNDFIGTCGIIPNNKQNDVTRGTDRVITAAHKLINLSRNERLKVRVQEYDASGFNERLELEEHIEYAVSYYRIHPDFDRHRLSNDIAVLHLTKRIDFYPDGVNAACLPACNNQFSHIFKNGTGVRCWTQGWGKDATGPQGRFQFIQNKVDLPLYERERCKKDIRDAIGRTNPRLHSRFRLHSSEICAGGEAGKDACEGDGGAPLVCQGESGLWYIVGLVAWGVGCGDPDVPGVYVNVFRMLDFILSPVNNQFF